MVPRGPPVTGRPSERIQADMLGPRLTVRLRTPSVCRKIIISRARVP
jgi:hypothetical protein